MTQLASASAPTTAFAEERSTLRSELRALLAASHLSRAQIAERLAALTGRKVTERMLHRYLAESREDANWPSELDLPLCFVLGNYSLLANRVRRAGYRMIGPEEEKLIEIGQAVVNKRKAEAILRGVRLG